MRIYHGSEKVIEHPSIGGGKLHNDYGRGFYCTEDLNLAKEWAVDENRNGFANKYEIDLSRLRVLDLTDENFTILNWITILIDNRVFDLHSDFSCVARRYMLDNFLPEYSDYDIIKGYRADDSYFSYAQDFLNNSISVGTLSKAMKLGNLGEQIVLKSKAAFENLRFVGTEEVNSQEWFPLKNKRDKKARADYHKMSESPWKRGEIYIMKIIDEEMKADDVRLQC